MIRVNEASPIEIESWPRTTSAKLIKEVAQLYGVGIPNSSRTI
jgi:hypothetical protein